MRRGGLGLAALAVGLSGFAGLTYEVAWMRVFGMIVGPTTYASAATVAAMIAGIAMGSGVGAWGAGRTRHHALWLALTLAATAIVAATASSLTGGYMPRLVAEELARSNDPASGLLWRSLLVAALMLPAAVGLGAVFPLALALVPGNHEGHEDHEGDTDKRAKRDVRNLRDDGGRRGVAAGRVGTIYAINTLAAVAGSLAAACAAIPFLGRQHTLTIAAGVLILDAVVMIVWGEPSVTARVATVAAAVLLITAPPWDRELLASGAYQYASRVPPDLDLEAALKAGTLLYYREGAASTVSANQLTGARSLAIDGKIDASSAGDMLTQKALAHLPLLLHPNPRDVCIIGLGSGVTVGSALVHPIARVDVVEISPEVVEASRHFGRVDAYRSRPRLPGRLLRNISV